MIADCDREDFLRFILLDDETIEVRLSSLPASAASGVV
jgi:hypothetical protein